MKIQLKAYDGKVEAGRMSGLFVYEDSAVPAGFNDKAGRSIIAEAKKIGFQGKLKQSILISPRLTGVPAQIILTGLGKKKEISYENIRIATAGLVKQAESLKQSSLDIVLPEKKEVSLDYKQMISAVTEAVNLQSYRFDKYQTKTEENAKTLESVNLYVPDTKAAAALRSTVDQAGHIADGVCFVRDLVNEPASAKYPAILAAVAKKLSKPGRITVKVFEKSDIQKMGMGGILGVNRGSHLPPVFIHLTYKPKKKSRKTVAFVGKGVTFDSGGINLKPSKKLETMKMDMAGAATVLGLFRVLQHLDLPVTVHGLIPATENLPGGGAMKPSDIIKAYNGKTIEVVNTDAEGRLILADALSYGVTLKPDVMIDMATLTGAIIVGIGMLITGMMGTDTKNMNRIQTLGEDAGEHFVQLPLLKEYKEHIKSHIADIKNIGAGKGAGAITAALFLQNFVGEIPWIHLDIAGTAWTDEDLVYCPRNGTGVPLRTLVNWLIGLP